MGYLGIWGMSPFRVYGLNGFKIGLGFRGNVSQMGFGLKWVLGFSWV